MTTIWDYESAISRRARRPSGKGWTRVCTFENIPSTTAESLIPKEWSVYPGETGNTAAVLVESDLILEHKPAASGGYYSKATLYYRPPTCEEWLEQNPNHAILRGRSSGTTQQVREVDGNVISGYDPTDTTGKSKWLVRDGKNIRFNHRAIYEVYGVIDNTLQASGRYPIDIFFYQFVCRVGRCNSNIFSNLPLWPETSRTGQWILSSLACSPRQSSNKLWTVNYQFMLNNDSSYGWRDPAVSEKWNIVARNVDVKNDAGDVIGTKVVSVFEPTGTTQSNRLVELADFSVVDNMLLDSW